METALSTDSRNSASVAMLAGLPEKPIKDLKKLLEIYADLLSINHSQVADDQALHLLDIWTGDVYKRQGTK